MTQATTRPYSGVLLAAIAIAVFWGLGGTLWSDTLNSKLAAEQHALSDVAAQNARLFAAQQDTNDRLNVATDELEILKHKGDRKNDRFTLVKGQKKVAVKVSLELKRADSKKSKYTIAVHSNDKKYESLNEPLQFYCGKKTLLFEIVVNDVSAKNTETGYLSSPKGAPAPAVIAER